ncbi:alpha/beta fold hydrolase [Synechococcales cyanobacterium C]|uniref:Alpha/beta fold hydrolase n=1 Tax=Petrachloros mirabilis ULC683 TaxID=2781853 RepID=A0A8K1ZY16_9CYAN|nr:alpha/beta hydrolase [Petrachloros mirabilis]NCJ05978.1 alpha/beta fold hydrolase [Petrachloros mirabilis ULC683]
MAFLPVRGIPHYYEWVTLPQTTHPKPVMVFLHGWGGSSRYWQSTAASLSDRFDCLLYDLRGFGRSSQVYSAYPGVPVGASLSEPYELETYADDLAALLDELGLPQVYLNAHSMGASIATFFLNRYPHRVARAILTCSGVFDYNPQAFQQFHQFGGYVVKFRPRWLALVPGVDRLFMARFLCRPIPPPERQHFLEDFLLADFEAALGTMITAVSEKAARVMPTEFAQLTVPTLLVAGERDRIIPAQMGEQAAAYNPLVQFQVLPQTAHFPMLEDASAYLECVSQFLDAAS